MLSLTFGSAIWGLSPLWSKSEALAPVPPIAPRTLAEDATTLFPTLLPRADESDLPDLSEFSEVSARKAAFYEFLLPLILVENERLLLKRDYLSDWLVQGVPEDTEVSEELKTLAENYYIDLQLDSEAILQQLLYQIDILPPSMVIAQAANESAWGTSRFATEGNNLFGQWCFTPGCGLVPQNRPEGETYEVRAFDSPALSVRAFLLNLNRHPSYAQLRDQRDQLRTQEALVTGLELVPYLVNYSIRREEYVAEIAQTIRFNNLQDLD